MQGEAKHWYRKWWGVLLLILFLFLGSVSVAFIFTVADIISGQPEQNNTAAPVTGAMIGPGQQSLLYPEENYFWLGAAKPKVTIVEFGDFSCGHCQKSFSKIREISLTHQDNIKFIWRDFPALGDTSILLAMAARCAGEQGFFWPMFDKLFQNQNIANELAVTQLAELTGVNKEKFSACLTNKKYLPEVQRDYNNGHDLGITGTPTWFINGQMIEGDIPYETFIQIIEKLLSGGDKID